MKLTRNLFSWFLVGVFTVFLAVGVEMVSHSTFTHGSIANAAVSSSTPGVSSITAATTGATASVGSATLNVTPPLTISRTYHDDGSQSSDSSYTGAANQDN